MPSLPLPRPPRPPGSNGYAPPPQQQQQSTMSNDLRFAAPPQQQTSNSQPHTVNGVHHAPAAQRFPPPPPMSGGAMQIPPLPPNQPRITPRCILLLPLWQESLPVQQHSYGTVAPPAVQNQMPRASTQNQNYSPAQNQMPPPPAVQMNTPLPHQSHLPPPVAQMTRSLPGQAYMPPPSVQSQMQMQPASQSHLPPPSAQNQMHPPIPQNQAHVYPPLHSHMHPPPVPQNQTQMHPPLKNHMHPPPVLQSQMPPPPPPSAHGTIQMHPPFAKSHGFPGPQSHMQMHPPSQSHMHTPSQSHAYPPTSHARAPPSPPTPYHNSDALDVSSFLLAAPIDDGNATPHVLRSTVYQFPATRAQWHSTGDVPLALQCMPLAVPSQDYVPPVRQRSDEPEQDEETIASVPMLPITNGPPRCTNCLAYANPFATDTKCIFCGVAQTHALVTVRPEATVEWEVTGPYITRGIPVQPVQLYVLDLTCPHVEEYKCMLKVLGQDMTDHYQQQSTRVVPRMGVCLVSSMGIMIPQWNATSGEISCMVVADVTEEPFAPVPLEEWTFTMDESAEVWTQFIDNLDLKHWRKQSFARNAYGMDGSELSCGGAALAFLSSALASSGGRGTLLTWRRPNFGVGALAFREESQALLLGRSKAENTTTYVPVQAQKKPEGTEDEAAASFYTKLAEECVTNRATLDVVMHTGPVSPNSFLGLASLGELCRVTSGRLYWVQAVQWEESLYSDLRDNIRAFSGWDAVFKVRCSAGVQIKNFIYVPGKSREGALGDSPELELASVSPNTCISVELDHRLGGIPKASSVVYFQTALLYTSLSGRRLVRVSTLAIPIARSVNDVFQGVDFPAVLSYLVRTTHTHLVKSINEQKKDDNKTVARQKVRDALYATCLNMLVNYRLHTPAISTAPLLCMCLLKRPLLAPGFPCRDQSSAGARIQPSGDERGYFNFQLLQSNPANCMLLLYPNIYSLDLSSNAPNDIKMARPSMESFQDDGIYLIDDGLRLFVYMGRLVPDEMKDACATRRHETLERCLSHIMLVQDHRPNTPVIIPVVQQPDHQGLRETEILSLMVEDASVGERDYVAFFDQYAL